MSALTFVQQAVTRISDEPELAPVLLPAVVGADLEVPVKGGRLVPYANLDYAASAPCPSR